jgi:hypothetical protein
MLLIRNKNPCRCQAENPLKLLSEFPGPALYFSVHKIICRCLCWWAATVATDYCGAARGVSGGNFSFISAAKIYGSDVVGVVLSGGDTTELKDPSG